MTIATVIEQFPDEDTARRWLEGVRWPEGRVCGHCGSPQTNTVSPTHPMPYWCTTCQHYFSLKTGTALQRSKLHGHGAPAEQAAAAGVGAGDLCDDDAPHGGGESARDMPDAGRESPDSPVDDTPDSAGHHLSIDFHQPAARGPGHVPADRKEDARRGRAEAVAEKRSGPGESGRAGHDDYGGASGQTVGALSPGGRRGVDGHDLPAGRS